MKRILNKRTSSLFFLLVAPCFAQANLWTGVTGDIPIPTRPATLSYAQRQKIVRSITAHEQAATPDWGQNCSVSDLADESHWKLLPVSSRHTTVLVEAGSCARGAQGSNGAMWLVRLDGGTPAVLASPAQQFSGWIYSLPPSTSHGYRDIVLGWHMSAYEASLSYFRFDGTRYKRIGDATLASDGNGNSKVVPGHTSFR